jgi:hypothetical protein
MLPPRESNENSLPQDAAYLMPRILSGHKRKMEIQNLEIQNFETGDN